MFTSKRMIWYWIVLVSGILIFIGAAAEVIEPSASGIGGGLAAVAAVRLLQGTKYRKNEEYSRHVDTAYSDERNMFIAGKAKSWAFYITLIGLAVITIILFIAKRTLYAQIAGGTLAVMTAIYWITYMILLRKY